MSTLRLADAQTLADLQTYAGRARSADEDGAIRLQAKGTTLAAYVGVLQGSGLMAEGAVIGLRVMPLAEPAELDVTVPLAAVTDRLARAAGEPSLSIPPMTASAGWAAVSPPRSGWERVGSLPADVLNSVAAQGIEEIATGAGEGSGGHAVSALRQQVWGRATSTLPPFPAGGAFAAYALGFCPPGSEVTVFAHGRWTRLSCVAGHVLIR